MLFSYAIPPHFRQLHYPLINIFSPFLTDERLTRMKNVVKKRSRFLLPVFEATNHAHNISAVLRSSEAFGWQDSFFVYNDMDNTRFRISDSVERGSAEWLFRKRFSSIPECAELLKSNGYHIALVSLPDFFRTSIYFKHELPHYSTFDLQQQQLQNELSQKRIALVFGNEKHGVSEEWGPWADFYVSIGMHGFVESLNMSVCAGILMHAFRQWVDHPVSQNANIKISEDEQNFILEHWICKNIESGQKILDRTAPDLIDYFLWQRKFT